MTRTFFMSQDINNQVLANPVKVFFNIRKALTINDLRARAPRPRKYIIINNLCQTKFNL